MWCHPKKGDDEFTKYDSLEEAEKGVEELKRKGYAEVEKPLAVYLENNRYYEAYPENLEKRTRDMILNGEIVGHLAGKVKEQLEASIADKEQLKALKNVITDIIYQWWIKEGE